MSCRKVTSRLALVLVALPILGLVAPAAAASPKNVPEKQQCLWQLIEGTDPLIDCIHPAWLTTEEQADVRRLTRDHLRNASCAVSVKISRAEIERALAAAEHVFQSPPQPVTCDLETSRGKVTITGTFSPRVVFKGGVAVEATPGLADIKGVNTYLAWPVVHYVNYAERISKTMLLMINAYRHYRGPVRTP